MIFDYYELETLLYNFDEFNSLHRSDQEKVVVFCNLVYDIAVSAGDKTPANAYLTKLVPEILITNDGTFITSDYHEYYIYDDNDLDEILDNYAQDIADDYLYGLEKNHFFIYNFLQYNEAFVEYCKIDKDQYLDGRDYQEVGDLIVMNEPL